MYNTADAVYRLKYAQRFFVFCLGLGTVTFIHTPHDYFTGPKILLHGTAEKTGYLFVK